MKSALKSSASKMPNSPPAKSSIVATDTKSRLIDAMLRALRTTGYHGTGLTEILASADAPKGVLYHHFPKGKAELAAAAIALTTEKMDFALKAIFASKAPLQGLEQLLHSQIERVVQSDFSGDFRASCPLANATLDASSAEPLLQAAVKLGFERWQMTIADGLTEMGLAPARASLLASLVLASYEGALLLARAHREPELIEQTASAVLAIIRAELVQRKKLQSRKSTPPKPTAMKPEPVKPKALKPTAVQAKPLTRKKR
jgi:TetR/AcrR family transcriptional regulator, lmrAB and yxaGH operons repressor